MSVILAIDPGLQGTGLAYWENSKTLAPSWVEVITYRKGDWLERAGSLATMIRNLLRDAHAADPGEVVLVCELMEMHQSARAQMMWKSGDFQRTLVYIGMIIAQTSRYVDRVVLTKPSEWKGQLPKPVVERRLRALLGPAEVRRLNIHTHAWDAVGMGLWHKKKF